MQLSVWGLNYEVISDGHGKLRLEIINLRIRHEAFSASRKFHLDGNFTSKNYAQMWITKLYNPHC